MYILCALASSKDLPERIRYQYLSMFLFIGLFVVGLFAVIFLLYTNSFLMKRRGRELGLYNILGMDKRNLAAMLFWETVYTARLVGIPGGILLGHRAAEARHEWCWSGSWAESRASRSASPGSGASGVCCAGVLGGILLLALLRQSRAHPHPNPAALLRSSETGEREPKTRWFLTILGVLSLGGGYYIALSAKDAMAAISLYFVAVFLVIIGTYCLFAAVSVFILKALRKNKRYYYKTQHFISVSGMLYRMKRNAVGLANICILSTMVLVMVSATVSLYLGTKDAARSRCPADFCALVRYDPSVSDPFQPDKMMAALESGVKKQGLAVKNARSVRFLRLGCAWQNGGYVSGGDAMLSVLTAADYEKLTGTRVSVKEGEVFVSDNCPAKDELRLNFSLNDFGWAPAERTYAVAGKIEALGGIGEFTSGSSDDVFAVLADDAALDDLWRAQNGALGEYGSDLRWEGLLDLSGTDDEKIACVTALSDSETLGITGSGETGMQSAFSSYTQRAESDAGVSVGKWSWYQTMSLAQNEQDLYSVNGGFLFLGIFLGVLFMLGMVLIIYYKQVAEGYEDRARFQIMRQVGLPEQELKKSVNGQILAVFFAPLLVAAVHAAFDYRLVAMLLTLFQLMNARLTLLCTALTLAGFAGIYAIVYELTAKVYLKIVGN
jgi:putative ABC transport system permease protein